MDQQPFQVGMFVQEPGQHAVAEQVRHFVEVAGGIEPLDRHVVGVVGPSRWLLAHSRIARRQASRTFCLFSSSVS